MLGERFSTQHNSLNFLRLCLALMVVFSHAVPAGAFGNEEILNGTGFGTVAVYGFFGISGYLIAGSAVRNGAGRYLWQRFLRIFPGFWVCLIVTAFVFGVVGWLSSPLHHCGLSCYFNARSGPFDYVYRDWFLKYNQNAISGTPIGVPLSLTWNSSLWTLFYEFLCYLLLVGLSLTGLLRRRVWVLLGSAGLWGTVALITVTPSLNHHFNVFDNWAVMNFLKFATIFMVGAVIYLYRERIPDSGWLALGCTAIFVGGLWLPTAGQAPAYTFTTSDLCAPFVAYPLLWLGIHLPFQRVGARNDYSYGIYIYAFPVTQLLVIWGAWRLGYPVFALLCVLGTIPFAVGSWWFIEKRALSWKKGDPKSVTTAILGPGKSSDRKPG